MKNTPSNKNAPEVRLDKWLWAARLFKTRSLARTSVQAGKVHYNGQRTKPSKVVELGATVKVPAGYDTKELVINEIVEQRRGAALVQDMYRETQSSVEQRERNAQARKLSAFHSPKPETKPDKKQRRQIIELKHQ
ncbi:ribosome-associated heat shock protein Hsp15 [Alteromonas sp. LMIT006]|uniref:ribosome-associated heat shock protein Hsp15 n=1 Tax=Alteromonadaceae TaxID=72275 RepID=UPI0020CA5EC4|nr:ribosome-associated heat shock protein Hsp15 [Alteromonas sp. LMIT006]UTP73099.1 ribosome-associated heat shock protein Hsp15 [Alteromonas sp. LMIT006]